MNCREVLQIYGPTYSHLSDKKLFEKMSDLCYKQVNHGVSWEYWKKSYGAKGYITPDNKEDLYHYAHSLCDFDEIE